MMLRALFILVSLVAPATEPTTVPVGQPDYFAMSSDEFAQCQAANQKLNYDRPDQTLISAGILHETNRWRAKEGLKPLVHHPQVDEAAMMHVKDMVAKNYLA